MRHVVEAGDRSPSRTCTGGDDGRNPVEPLAADDETALGEAARLANDEYPIIPAEQPIVVRRAVRDDASDAAHHGATVDPDVRVDAELVTAARKVRDLGGPDQGLRRDAPDVDSGPAQRCRLEDRDTGTEPTRTHRRRDAAHSTADDNEIGPERCDRGHPRSIGGAPTMPTVGESETLGRHRILPHGGRDLLVQIGLFASLQLVYEIVRGQVDGAAALAFAHGQAIIDLEQDLGIDVERAIQDWTIGQGDAVLWVANQTYLNCQFSISFCFVLWVYLRRNWAYLRLRNTLLAAEVLGLVGYLAIPTAPPRFLGYVDTLDQTVYSLNEGPLALLANPYAAMPQPPLRLRAGDRCHRRPRLPVASCSGHLGPLSRAGLVLDHGDGKPLPARRAGRRARPRRGRRSSDSRSRKPGGALPDGTRQPLGGQKRPLIATEAWTHSEV